MSDQPLMDYFKFDAADLQANRNGQLTEKQKAFLITDEKYAKFFNWVAAIFLLLFSAWPGVIAVAMAVTAILNKD